MPIQPNKNPLPPSPQQAVPVSPPLSAAPTASQAVNQPSPSRGKWMAVTLAFFVVAVGAAAYFFGGTDLFKGSVFDAPTLKRDYSFFDYSFSNLTEGFLTDLSPQALNAISINFAAAEQNEIFGAVGRFAGNELLRVLDPQNKTDVGTDDFVLSGWFRPDAAAQGRQGLFGKYDLNASAGYSVFLENGRLGIDFSVPDEPAGNFEPERVFEAPVNARVELGAPADLPWLMAGGIELFGPPTDRYALINIISERTYENGQAGGAEFYKLIDLESGEQVDRGRPYAQQNGSQFRPAGTQLIYGPINRVSMTADNSVAWFRHVYHAKNPVGQARDLLRPVRHYAYVDNLATDEVEQAEFLVSEYEPGDFKDDWFIGAYGGKYLFRERHDMADGRTGHKLWFHDLASGTDTVIYEFVSDPVVMQSPPLLHRDNFILYTRALNRRDPDATLMLYNLDTATESAVTFDGIAHPFDAFDVRGARNTHLFDNSLIIPTSNPLGFSAKTADATNVFYAARDVGWLSRPAVGSDSILWRESSSHDSHRLVYCSPMCADSSVITEFSYQNFDNYRQSLVNIGYPENFIANSFLSQVIRPLAAVNRWMYWTQVDPDTGVATLLRKQIAPAPPDLSVHYLTDGPVVAGDTWSHVAAVFNRDGEATLYVNGQSVGSVDISSQADDLAASAPLVIGARAVRPGNLQMNEGGGVDDNGDDSPAVDFYHGLMGPVQMFRFSGSDADRDNLFNADDIAKIYRDGLFPTTDGSSFTLDGNVFDQRVNDGVSFHYSVDRAARVSVNIRTQDGNTVDVFSRDADAVVAYDARFEFAPPADGLVSIEVPDGVHTAVFGFYDLAGNFVALHELTFTVLTCNEGEHPLAEGRCEDDRLLNVPDDLLVHLDFEDGFRNWSRYAYDLLTVGNPEIHENSQDGHMLHLDGTDDLVRLRTDNPDLYPTDAVTYSLWLYPETLPEKMASIASHLNRGVSPLLLRIFRPSARLVEQYGIGPVQTMFYLKFEDASRTVFSGLHRNSEGMRKIWDGSFSSGQWYHLIATYDARTGFRLYVNNELAGVTERATQGFVSGEPYGGFQLGGFIGGDYEDPARGYQDRIRGYVDNVRVYNRVLSEDEIAELFAETPGDIVIPDEDADGVPDETDNCRTVANDDQTDSDHDGIGDVCDDDIDGDSINNENDNCPADANGGQEDFDEDRVGDVCDDDRDGDTVENAADNCPDVSNEGQENMDGDGEGDSCDEDADGDAIENVSDNCPFLANPDQGDIDNNGIGDLCDTDRDGDNILNDLDNCPNAANEDQADLDGDGAGDACDDDRDSDNVPDERDNCPIILNPEQFDTDRDGTGDVCDDDRDGDGIGNDADVCPDISNPEQIDFDVDGAGDLCDDDMDGDLVANNSDVCPAVPDPDQADGDDDGIGDLCDNDFDNDNVLNVNDNCLLISNEDQSDVDGDSAGDACDNDIDGDGVLNAADNCPNVSNNGQNDLNGDGFGDECADDIDGDGVLNETDNCLFDVNPDQSNLDGDRDGDVCDLDRDGDGIANAADACADDRLNQCGAGVAGVQCLNNAACVSGLCLRNVCAPARAVADGGACTVSLQCALESTCRGELCVSVAGAGLIAVPPQAPPPPEDGGQIPVQGFSEVVPEEIVPLEGVLDTPVPVQPTVPSGSCPAETIAAAGFLQDSVNADSYKRIQSALRLMQRENESCSEELFTLPPQDSVPSAAKSATIVKPTVDCFSLTPSFDPQQGEKLYFSCLLSSDADRLTLSIFAPDKLDLMADSDIKAGLQLKSWDGAGSAGTTVSPGTYNYIVVAENAAGQGIYRGSVIVAGPAGPVLPAATTSSAKCSDYFIDISDADSRCAATLFARERGWFLGTPDSGGKSLLKLDKPFNRVEFAAVVTRIMGNVTPLPNASLQFADVDSSTPQWIRDTIDSAVATGAFSGDRNGNFLYNSPLERAQMWKTVRQVAPGFSAAVNYDVSPWYAELEAEMLQLGLDRGHPRSVVTRGEAIEFIYRVFTR